MAESIYSMDGDRALLREIVELKERFDAWLMLDEAHGVGVIGHHGRGLADELGLADRIEIQMGTLGKALGSSGAYICGSSALRDYLINRARSFDLFHRPAAVLRCGFFARPWKSSLPPKAKSCARNSGKTSIPSPPA